MNRIFVWTLIFFTVIPCCFSSSFFPENGTGKDATVEKILKNVKPGQEFVQIDDMRFKVDDLAKSGFSGSRWNNGDVFSLLSKIAISEKSS